MIDLSSKLAHLQALNYACGVYSTSTDAIVRKILDEKEKEILVLQREILVIVNNLNGERVF